MSNFQVGQQVKAVSSRPYLTYGKLYPVTRVDAEDSECPIKVVDDDGDEIWLSRDEFEPVDTPKYAPGMKVRLTGPLRTGVVLPIDRVDADDAQYPIRLEIDGYGGHWPRVSEFELVTDEPAPAPTPTETRFVVRRDGAVTCVEFATRAEAIKFTADAVSGTLRVFEVQETRREVATVVIA